MIVFAPRSDPNGFKTVTFSEFWKRAGGDGTLIQQALQAGSVTAFVQPEGEPVTVLYEVPADHWRQPEPFLEGQPGDTLWCWGCSKVPVKFRDRPLLFLSDEVSDWARSLQVSYDPRETDRESLREIQARGKQKPREGMWSPWATLAWIVSHDDAFVAEAQQYEKENHAERGGEFSAAAWMVLGDVAGEHFGKTFSMAEQELREALESGRLEGGVAFNMATRETEPVPWHRWADWDKAFADGMSFLRGYRQFKWASAAVRAAFPQPRAEDDDESEAPAGRGRTPGESSTRKADMLLLPGIMEALEKDSTLTPWQACGDAAVEARGIAQPERKQKRLRALLREVHGV